jgi:cytosine/adenosine deaminase-related metal-dependent hydrolase
LHTHLAEDPEEDDYCLSVYGRRPIDHFDEVGWGGDRAWVAHCICPNPDEIARLGAWGTGVAHCPSSNMILGGGLAPVREFRAAGVPVGLGCDGSSSGDSASLWMEARNAMLLGRLRHGSASMSARDALEIATVGGAGCLGRRGEIGELSVGAVGDLVVWPLTGIAFAGALSDPIEAWLRCGPVSALHTVVAGRLVVEGGVPTHPGVDEMLARHRTIATGMQTAVENAGTPPAAAAGP